MKFLRQSLIASILSFTVCLPVCLAAAEPPKHDYRNEIALIETWLDAQRSFEHIPSLSAALVHDQRLIWSGASGYADIEQQTPARADTIYGICSISKLFTGIAVMQLRDQGKLGLDQPLDELLPWYELEQAFPDSPDISLRSVLTHSAGLPRESEAQYWRGPDYPFPSSEKMRELLDQQTTLYPAQRYFQYSNLGLSLAGEVVADKSGQSYDSYVRQHILQPLGLHDTDTGFPTDQREPRVATGYGYPRRDGVVKATKRYDGAGITPAAGFASTALDLASFASWQLRTRNGQTNEVLAPNTLRDMQRVHWMEMDWSTSWGLAFGVYRVGDTTLVGHSGGCPGFTTRLYIEPSSEYAVSLMANSNGVDVSGYARTLLKIIQAGGTPQADDAAEQTDYKADEYAGRYDWYPWGGEALILRWKGGLYYTHVPADDPLENLTELKHVSGDRFQIVREDGAAGHEILFTRDNDGRVNGMKEHSNVAPRLRAIPK